MQTPLLHSILVNAKEIPCYIGPLVGLYAGSYLTKSTQRKQWLLDRRREEFREVVSAMTHATIELQVYLASKGSPAPQPWNTWLDAHKIASRTLVDRIYIADDIAKAHIAERYIEAGGKVRDRGEPTGDAVDEVDRLIRELVKIAQTG